MKKEFNERKEKIKKLQKLKTDLEDFLLTKEEVGICSKEPQILMESINQEIAFSQNLFDCFEDNLSSNFEENNKKYNFTRINNHLKIIQKEYEMLNQELEEIINQEEE